MGLIPDRATSVLGFHGCDDPVSGASSRDTDRTILPDVSAVFSVAIVLLLIQGQLDSGVQGKW
jgi:hypothetical protein